MRHGADVGTENEFAKGLLEADCRGCLRSEEVDRGPGNCISTV